MRHFAKSLAVFPMAALLLLSACVSNNPVKPWTPDRTVGLIVLKNPDPKVPRPHFVNYEPVSFENAATWELRKALQGASVTGAGFKSADLYTRCFDTGVCILFNLMPGRYHVSGFGRRNGNETTIYNLKGPMVQEETLGKAMGSLMGGKETPSIFNANDLYFVVPPGSTGFAGSFQWSTNPQGALARLFGVNGTFAFERDPKGMDERAALQALMGDPEFTKSEYFADWVPVVQRRLVKLAQPPPPVAAPPAPAPVTSRSKKSSR